MLPFTQKCATISLAKNPGSLVRITFRSARGRNCTCTGPLLRRMSLLLDYAGKFARLTGNGTHPQRHADDDRSVVETPSSLLETTAATPRACGGWSAHPLGDRGQGISAPGRIRTDTEQGLSPLPLHWATGAMNGPGGRTCTRTGRGLSSLPLRWATPGKRWCSRQESRLQPPRSKRGALYIELREH